MIILQSGTHVLETNQPTLVLADMLLYFINRVQQRGYYKVTSNPTKTMFDTRSSVCVCVCVNKSANNESVSDTRVGIPFSIYLSLALPLSLSTSLSSLIYIYIYI